MKTTEKLVGKFKLYEDSTKKMTHVMSKPNVGT